MTTTEPAMLDVNLTRDNNTVIVRCFSYEVAQALFDELAARLPPTGSPVPLPQGVPDGYAVGLWGRIGNDGLPPLAIEITHLDKVFARVVDETTYRDFTATDVTRPRYVVELLVNGEFREEERAFTTQHEAFHYAIALHQEANK